MDVASLLASSGSDWNQRISTLSNKIHDLKKEISEEIVQSCVDFMPMMSDLQDIKKKMDSVQTDAHHLTTSIDDIVSCYIYLFAVTLSF